jgi:hypothetical protein
MSSLEPKYSVFDSVEQMLAPNALSESLSKPVAYVDVHPMNGHSGLAGGRLSYVDTNSGRMVLKQMSMHSDWIMFSSADHECRSVMLWQYGLLDQIRPQVEHEIIGCARDGEGWAILMNDLTGCVYAWDKPIPPEQIHVFLDSLARIHATFWNDPRLNDSRLGLCDVATLIDQTSPMKARKHLDGSLGVLPGWIHGGWEVMKDLLDPDVFAQMNNLIENRQPLLDALHRYPSTLLHGDYRADNLAYPNHPAVLDWQEASYALMTIDLAWFVLQDFGRDRIGQSETIKYYRGQLETYLNQRFDDTDWQGMLDLGFLVNALRSTCFPAYWYKQGEIENNIQERNYHESRVKMRNQQVRDAMRWLGK